MDDAVEHTNSNFMTLRFCKKVVCNYVRDNR